MEKKKKAFSKRDLEFFESFFSEMITDLEQQLNEFDSTDFESDRPLIGFSVVISGKNNKKMSNQTINKKDKQINKLIYNFEETNSNLLMTLDLQSRKLQDVKVIQNGKKALLKFNKMKPYFVKLPVKVQDNPEYVKDNNNIVEISFKQKLSF